MFCPKCGSLMKPKLIGDKRIMACSCGYHAAKDSGIVKFTEKKTDVKHESDVIDSEASAYPIIDEECPKCHNPKAYTWSQQMRAGDEPETIFFKCTKCAHTWRAAK